MSWNERFARYLESQKEERNRAKHGVSFDEARSVFFYDRAKLIADPDHSVTEDRYIPSA